VVFAPASVTTGMPPVIQKRYLVTDIDAHLPTETRATSGNWESAQGDEQQAARNAGPAGSTTVDLILSTRIDTCLANEEARPPMRAGQIEDHMY